MLDLCQSQECCLYDRFRLEFARISKRVRLKRLCTFGFVLADKRASPTKHIS